MLTWALHELTQSPEYMARIVAEADGVFGTGNGPETPLPGMERLNDLVFSQCCLKASRVNKRRDQGGRAGRDQGRGAGWDGRQLQAYSCQIKDGRTDGWARVFTICLSTPTPHPPPPLGGPAEVFGGAHRHPRDDAGRDFRRRRSQRPTAPAALLHDPQGHPHDGPDQGVHHRGDIWPEPQAYRPDRFLSPPKPFTFLPFIDGPRKPPGPAPGAARGESRPRHAMPALRL